MAGKLFVISGPSGAGKGTLVAELVRRVPDVFVSVSATTRAARSGEKEGRDYHFMSGDAFQRLVADGGMLEWAEVHGNRYGTPREEVDRRLASEQDVVLEIDVQGARQVKAARPDAVTVFILPPSVKELRRRLTGRRTEGREEVEERLKNAIDELALAPSYDHVVVNDDVGRAAGELVEIVEAERGEESRK